MQRPGNELTVVKRTNACVVTAIILQEKSIRKKEINVEHSLENLTPFLKT